MGAGRERAGGRGFGGECLRAGRARRGTEEWERGGACVGGGGEVVRGVALGCGRGWRRGWWARPGRPFYAVVPGFLLRMLI